MMRLARAAALALAAMLAVGATSNWTSTVAETAGGHVLGNPAAKTKVIEFVSYTCPHCANFEREAGDAIKLAWVQPGKVSVEVRHIVRDPVDLAVATLANCGAKDRFLRNHTMFMLSHNEWMGKVREATPAQRQRWSSGTIAARMRAIAGDLGLDKMMVGRGYTASQVDACLANEAAVRRIADLSEANGTTYGVTGTPSFALNGKLLDGVHSWAQLQAAIAPRLN